MKLVAEITLKAALLAASVIGATAAAPFNATVDGFSIDLPPGWIQIPPATIEQAEREVIRRAPKARPAHSDYAFQFGSRDQWFTYPYVLIHVDRQGRIPEPELAKADKFSSTTATAKAQDALRGAADDLEIGKMRYDSSSHVLWFRTGSNVTDVGRILGVSAIIPTQHGHIDISGYSREQDYIGFVSVFQELVGSVAPDASTKYQVELSDRIPFLRGFKWESLLTSALVGAIMAAVGGTAAWRRKKWARVSR